MFTNRWRWNATRALALLRHAGGRKVPLPIQRMRSEDLLASVFPEQVQCQDNRAGPITPPDHPLVNETIANCLHEAMDLDGLGRIVAALEEGRLEFHSVETPAPSAMSQEILNANPYAFLDDAPLEERRARAVALRRTDPELAKGLGALDPQAIAEVLEQARPAVRDADELHDLLLTVGLLPVEEVQDWEDFAAELVAARRAAIAAWPSAGGERKAYVAAERLHLLGAALPGASLNTQIESPVETAPPEPDEAVKVIVQGWMEQAGPTTASRLAERLGLTPDATDRAMLALEGSGAVLRGSFTGTTDEVEWCDRRLLARIHRTTIGRLRREIEPVPAADLVRFLLRWQRVQPGTQLHGRDGVARVIEQLQGLELPAPAWEEHVLPARVGNYSPGDLEDLCLSGVVTWGKLSVNGRAEEATEANEHRPRTKGQRPARSTPIAFVLREDLPAFLEPREEGVPSLGGAAGDVAGYLLDHGASFLADIAAGTGRMPAEVEEALWELVSLGLVTGDGIAGLRTLLRGPEERRRRATRLRAVPGHRARRHLPLGRWSLWGPGGEPRDETERNETIAGQLLARYGVVLRELLARERIAPSWRTLLGIYRRWEAQGRIRGGRFVSGFVGDQFALPEAVEALRAVRRAPEETEPVILSAADPLNLVGIILPGDRVSPLSGLAIAYRNGVAEEIGPLGAIRSRLGSAGVRGS
jgi:ATP-dependent Lhr-like helicase